MNTSYPHHHSPAQELLLSSMCPVCVYCLHRLGAAPTGGALSTAMRRALEDDHLCVEKVNARRPEVSLPYN
jgi:hypothetical protein